MQPSTKTPEAQIPDVYDDRRLCRVTFTVRASLQPEQHVRVLGSAPNLGWDYDRGLKLVSAGPDGASPPEWGGSVGLPTHSAVEYKYVVCDSAGFCYSLSPIRRLFLKKEGVQADDGEHMSHTKYERIQRGDFAFQLKVQLELPPSFITPAGFQPLGITLYDHEQPSEVTISTRDTSAKVVETQVLTKGFYDVASFQFSRSSDVKSLHVEVKSNRGAVGRGAVLVSQLASSHHGVITTPLLDSAFVVIGEVVFRYLVVTPFSHPHIAHTTLPQSRMAFPVPHKSSTLLIGHRGTGAAGSRKLVEGKVRSHIQENTVLSFATAGSLGAQLVEFDVHLTSDLVPVIYHDFTTHLGESDMPIHSMTYEKFCKMGKRDVSKSRSLEDLKERAGSTAPIHDMFPTLRQTLQRVPRNIGFNVEIKYPVADEIEQYNLRPVNRNIYLDNILWEIYEHAKDRFIVFSSFDPDICLMLAAKQPHYPVFFLTQLGTVIRSDPRSNSPEASIDFALSAGLGGLVCPAKHLLENPGVISQIKSNGLRVCTWGSDNNNPVNVHFQKKAGVDGVIVDHVAHIAKHWGDS